MQKAFFFFALFACFAGNSFADLAISNGAASSISSSGAVLACSLTATNSTNTTLTCYYGTGAGGTNTAWWQYSNQLGIAVSLTTTSITISNLSPATYYYYRWKAVGTNTAWAAAASNFSTLATLGTNFPAPGTNGISVQAQTNGHLLAPLHFFSANLDLMLAAGLSSSGDVSTVQSNLDNHANATGTNVHGLGSAAVEDAGAFDAAGAAAGVQANLTEHTTNTANPHAVTAAQAGAVGTNDAAYLSILRTMTNFVHTPSPTNYLAWDPDTRTLSGCVTNVGAGSASGTTNQIMAYDGVLYTITNSPAAGDVLKFDPTTSNAWFTVPETLWPAVSNNVVYTNSLYRSFQQFTSIVTQDAGGTCTVTYAHGALIQIVPTTNLTITFDSTNYPTNGVNRVGIEIWADTNPVAFATATITNVTAPTVSTSSWTSLFFRRVTTNLWYGRQ